MRRSTLTTAAILAATVLAGAAGCASRPDRVVAPAITPVPAAVLPAPSGYAWNFLQDEYEAKLAYGVPDSDDLGLMLSCQPKSGRIAVSYPADAADPAGVVLASGKVSSRYAGKADADLAAGGMGAWAEAETTSKDRTLSAFAQTGELRMETKGAARTFSAKADEAANVRKFLSACG